MNPIKSLFQKFFWIFVLSVVLASSNVIVWVYSRNLDSQMGWIAFALVWLNLIIAWLTYRRTAAIAYFFVALSVILEAFVLLNVFWISTQVL